MLTIRNPWLVLAVLFAVVMQFTLNWFDLVACFTPIAAELSLSFTDIGLLIGVFLLGYGLFHLPTGLMTARFGMQNALTLGCAIQCVGVLLSAFSNSFAQLLVARVLGGVGGSILLGSTIGIVAATFPRQHTAFATSMLTGLAFTCGAGAGIYAWHPVVQAFGWRPALLIGGALSVLCVIALALVRLQSGAAPLEQHGSPASRAVLARVLRNRAIWLWGLANVGMYGAYGTLAQLMPVYAEKVLHADKESAARVSLVLLVSGLPASFVAGWYVDSKSSIRIFFIGACASLALVLAMLPLMSLALLYAAAAALGFLLILANAAWFSIPATQASDIELEDVPAAIGLMLTLTAVGAFVNPIVFARVASAANFTWAWDTVGALAVIFSLACLGVPSLKRNAPLTEGHPAS